MWPCSSVLGWKRSLLWPTAPQLVESYRQITSNNYVTTPYTHRVVSKHFNTQHSSGFRMVPQGPSTKKPQRAQQLPKDPIWWSGQSASTMWFTSQNTLKEQATSHHAIITTHRTHHKQYKNIIGRVCLGEQLSAQSLSAQYECAMTRETHIYIYI